jgi:hypothetical protein
VRENVKCQLCRRESETNSNLCRYHAQAKRVLLAAYNAWGEAYSGLEWKEYLDKVKQLPETGQWVKEVIGQELIVDKDA